jgi:hypothetical protein
MRYAIVILAASLSGCVTVNVPECRQRDTISARPIGLGFPPDKLVVLPDNWLGNENSFKGGD